MQTAIDNLRSALGPSSQKLYMWNDRYCNAIVNNFTHDYDPTGFSRFCMVTIEFQAYEGVWLSETQSINTWDNPVSGNSQLIVVGGTAPAVPTIIITLSASGSFDLKFDLGGGKFFTLIGTLGVATTIYVNTTAESVVISYDGTSRISFFDGQFLILPVGNNNLTYTKNSGTATISRIQTVFRNSWY